MTSLLPNSWRPCAWLAETSATPFWDLTLDGCHVRVEPFAREELGLVAAAQQTEQEQMLEDSRARSWPAALAPRGIEPDEEHVRHRPIAVR